MICTFDACRKNIPARAADRIEVRLVDGEEKAFGKDAPDGTLEQATGSLVRAYHHRCFMAWRRRERLRAARAADPSSHSGRVRDWHDQEVAEVGGLRNGLGGAD
jgi:hypothetical protein